MDFVNRTNRANRSTQAPGKRLLKTVFAEVAAEMNVALKEAEAHLVSRSLERHLDDLICRAGAEKTYRRFEALHMRLKGTSTSCEPDGFADDDFFPGDEPLIRGLSERKRRIRLKLAFLYRVYGEEAMHRRRAG